MLPSASELEYFIEVCNSLNLSRAATRLAISQPSLSIAIKRLEQAIGTELFVRHKHGVMLTQAGKQLLPQARLLLQLWQQTKSHALASQEEVQGCFTLGCHTSIAIHIGSRFLADLLESYPKLQIEYRHDISRRVTDQVINLSVDIGIAVNPFKHPDLVIRKLCEDEVTFWVGPGKREIQNIHSEKCVLVCDPDLAQTQSLLQRGKKMGISTHRLVSTSNLGVIAAVVANGCGIGILPSRVAMSIYPDKLKRIPNAPVFNDEICLVYRHENRSIRAIQVIAEAIKRTIPFP